MNADESPRSSQSRIMEELLLLNSLQSDEHRRSVLKKFPNLIARPDELTFVYDASQQPDQRMVCISA